MLCVRHKASFHRFATGWINAVNLLENNLSTMNPHLFCTVLLLCLTSTTWCKSGIRITDNGYYGIIVAFHPDIPESEGLPLIPKIQELFKKGSEALFQATLHRAYIENVTIVVPESWTRRKEFTVASSETFSSADVRIDSPTPRYRDGPYTLQTLPCGQPGMYIHLTPNYLKFLNGNSTAVFGDPGKTLVHEWAHLRYGVFDEFGFHKNPDFPLFYYDSHEEKVLPNACSDAKLNGNYVDITTKGPCEFTGRLPNENCYFIPDLKNNRANTSMASYHFLPNVQFFCNHTHNVRAPNKQNAMCDYQSTWKVISNHEDFKDNKNPPLKTTPSLEPNFAIVQRMEDTFSVVLDVSGNMDEPRQYPKLKMATDILRQWLKQDVKEGSAVGIITFSTYTIQKGAMMKINEASRKKLIQELPTATSTSTCIGCGLNSGIQQLKTYRQASGGTIILLTDGLENVSLSIEDVQGHLVEAKIRVNTIAFTKDADPKITKLADMTGGKAYFVQEGNLQALGAAFYDSITYQTTDFDLPVKIADDVFTPSDTQKMIHGSFLVDDTVGNATTIDFRYYVMDDIQNITITGPGLLVSTSDPKNPDFELTDDTSIQNVQFRFLLLKSGKYNYAVTRSGQKEQKITVTVKSKAKGNGVKPITTRCWAELRHQINRIVVAIFAEVMQGNNPVIDAVVVVQITLPDNENKLMQLFDKGNGDPDMTRHDGIYSGYYKKFHGAGNYGFKAQVYGGSKASIQDVGFIASQSMPVVNDYMANIEVVSRPAGNFQRSAEGGSILMTKEDIASSSKTDTRPTKIRNLQAANSNSEDFTVTLQWTAPGTNDDDEGKAMWYELRYSKSWDVLFTEFQNGTLVGVDVVPSSGGSDEEAKVHVDNADIGDTYFFAIKAYSSVNQESPTSNIAQSSFRLQKNDEVGMKSALSGGTIAGIVISVVLFLIVVGLCCLLWKLLQSLEVR